MILLFPEPEIGRGTNKSSCFTTLLIKSEVILKSIFCEQILLQGKQLDAELREELHLDNLEDDLSFP